MKHRNTKYINAFIQHALRVSANNIPPQATTPEKQLSDEDWQRVSECSFGVEAYAAIRGTSLDEDSEGSLLGDMLTDLMHWADFFGYDFDLALARARGHYAEESTADPYAHAKAAHADGELQYLAEMDDTRKWIDVKPDHTLMFTDPPSHYRRKPKVGPTPKTTTKFGQDHPAVVLEVIAANVTHDVDVQRSLCNRWEKQWAISSQLRATAGRYSDIRDMVEGYMRHWLKGEIEAIRLGLPLMR